MINTERHFRKFMTMTFVLFFCITGCSQTMHKDSGFFMGTFVEVLSSDPRAKDIVFEGFKKYEKMFNIFDQESELSRLNRSGDMVVSVELFEILTQAQKFYQETNGAFDVTVGQVSLLWKKAIKSEVIPSDSDVKSALCSVGFNNVFLIEKERRVKFLKQGIRIDLGGIADGFALDKIVSKLKSEGIKSAIINVGGDVYCLGSNGTHPWKVGIQDPNHTRHLIKRVEVIDRAVSTSGSYEQSFIFKNKHYSHIINPKTGYPAESGLSSVTVISQSATEADALSTAIMVLGKDEAKKILKTFGGVHAILIDSGGNLFEI